MKEKIDNKYIFIFWYPLALTWLMMALEQPFLTAVIARLTDAKINLAAFGVASSFALIAESPVIMLMSASTALVKDRLSFKKLRRFTVLINVFITAAYAFLLLPPVFNWIVFSLIKLTPEVGILTYRACLFLLPWPAAIGFRRFYQGLLIRSGKTRKVTYGTLFRLAAMTLTALGMYSADMDGAVTGGAALSAGVLAEALFVRFAVSREIREYLRIDKIADKDINLYYIMKFYIPLAMTSILSLAVHPFVTFFIGRSRMPLESLAVLPVINSIVFLFRCFGLSFQEVVIALMGKAGKNYKKLKQFAIYIGGGLVAGMGMIAFTPLSYLWFSELSGLSPDLAEFARYPLMILFLLPAFSTLLSFQRGVLVASKGTSPITYATGIEVLVIIIALAVLIGFSDLTGAVAAGIAYMSGRLLSCSFLLDKQRAAIIKIRRGSGF